MTLSIGLAVAADEQPVTGSGAANLGFVGSDYRIGLGFTDEGDVYGDFDAVFGAAAESTWMLDGWLGQAGAAGLKFNRHWLWGVNDLRAALDQGQSVTVAKAFVGFDQNSYEDAKATIGAGFERERYFVDLYYSSAISGRRLASSSVVSVVDQISGIDASGRPFVQPRTTTTTTDVYEKPYDHGVGARIGTFLAQPLVELSAGVDYESGDFSSTQTSLSLDLEKYFAGTPISVGAGIAYQDRDGDFVVEDNDTIGFLRFSYHFGQHFRRPDEAGRYAGFFGAEWAGGQGGSEPEATSEPRADVVEKPAELVKNRVALSTDAFFDFDQSTLRAETIAELERIVGVIKTKTIVGSISITGHTCSIGTERYNQGLSERRATAVREFLISRGVAAEQLSTQGKGELAPAHPNDNRANRAKNRRVDVEFLTEESTLATATATPGRELETGKARWERTPVVVPPGWIERALRNPARHKRSVDTYRVVETSTEVSLGSVTLVNRPPVAVNDMANAGRGAATVIDVLANDSDPDGDSLTVIEVSTPANGTVNNLGGGIAYTPRAGFIGSESFSYRISDGRGGSAQAQVTVTVSNAAPIAVDDQAQTTRRTAVTIDVLANDRDPDGGALTVVSVGTPSAGSADIVDGRIRYTPNAGFAGTDRFSYTVRDSDGATATAQVAVDVINRAPVANPDSASGTSGVTLIIDALANDSDPDGDPLRITALTPSVGTATVTSDGRVSFNAPGFVGTATVAYTIADSFGLTANAVITVVLGPTGGPPVARDDVATVFKGDLIDIDVLANDSDPDNDPLTIVDVETPAFGTARIVGGRVRYESVLGLFTGNVRFRYTISDGRGNTATAQITVTVTRF